MSASSFSTLSTDSVDSNTGAMKKTTKSGSVILSMSMAQFYHPTRVSQNDDDDFGEDNPFVKEFGLDDKERLNTRKAAIQEAANLATKKLQQRPGMGEKQPSARPGIGDKQLSSTQFTVTQHRAEYTKRQDASSRAFQPAILQALTEKEDDVSSAAPLPVKSIAAMKKPAPKKSAGVASRLKAFVFGTENKRKSLRSKRLIPPRKEEEREVW